MKKNKLLSFGIELTTATSNFLQKFIKNNYLGVRQKQGVGGDISLTGDIIVEKFLNKMVKRLLPKYNFASVVLVGEEFGAREIYIKNRKRGNSIFIIIDPIDGSKNLKPFKMIAPYVGLSLALGFVRSLSIRPKGFEAIDVAIVKDLFHEDIYSAVKGQGAYFKQKERIQVSPIKKIEDITLSVGLDHRGEKLKEMLKKITPLLIITSQFRRLGSLCLDTCRVAIGATDVFLSLSGRAKVPDLAAVSLIMKEAGGIFKYQVSGSNIFLPQLIIEKKNEILGKFRFSLIVTNNLSIYNGVKKLLR